MDKLSDLLGQKQLPPRDDVTAILDHISSNYNLTCRVELSGQTIMITVPSAAMAQTLRMELHIIKQRYDIEKKLAIRIGT